MFKIGCHVSAAGGVFNAPKNAADLGCETFQIFSRSPRGGPAAKLTPDVIKQFKLEMEKYKMSDFAIHCPYYINYGSSNPRIYHGSSSVVREELERGSLLGAKYVMTHLGSAGELPLEEALTAFQEGVGLVKECQTLLSQAEQKVEVLTKASAGAIETKPFQNIE